ncbi:MAG: four helix bundle protein [Thermoleophilia bacterium]
MEIEVATLRKFEDVKAWQKARELNQAIYTCSNSGLFARDFALGNQIRRASVSVMSNIAEGFERGGNSEFIQFLAVAKGSAGEVGAQMYVALDQGYVTQDEFSKIQSLTVETSNLIAGFMAYLSSSTMKGQKYRMNDLNKKLGTRN